MTTWPEARAAKSERQRREARHFTPDLLGPICRFCRTKVPNAIATDVHPACGPEARELLLQDGAR